MTPKPQRPHRIHALAYDIAEGIAERYRMIKTSSMDPDPEVGRNIAAHYKKLQESKARTDAERARLDESPEAGEAHRHSNPDARKD